MKVGFVQYAVGQLILAPYQHGSIGVGPTLVRSAGLPAPMVVWVANVALSTNGGL